ncbi:hypothetical protein A4X13_0g5258 [Tilletia indica]|uniref:Uncharacterized protein n=1 Tax=Tilletia indica TaxID=43049 RepID=A0A177TNZ2_9BASI|nr:hypothetical protein A4X13_0g5258 [Tilletia indica]
MAHFRILITLLPFLVSTTFALPLEDTSYGRSPTALQPDGAVLQPIGHDVHYALPGRLGVMPPTYLSAEAAETAGLLTRGDPPIKEAIKWYDEAARLAESPDVEYAKVVDALRNGKKAVAEAMSSIQNKIGVAKPLEIVHGKPIPVAKPVEVLHGQPIPVVQPIGFHYGRPIPFAQPVQVLEGKPVPFAQTADVHYGKPVWHKVEPGSSSGTKGP